MRFTPLSLRSTALHICNVFSLPLKQNDNENGPCISLCLQQSIDMFLSVAPRRLVWAGPTCWLELTEFQRSFSTLVLMLSGFQGNDAAPLFS